jgi:cyanophycin synthetase
MERQVPGTVHRVLLLESSLLDVLRRHAPRVVGDGVSSIFELMLAENERRLTLQGEAGIDLLRVDLDCLTTLRVRGRTLNDVPAAGEVEVVKTVTNQNCASDNESLGRSISPALLDDCIAAARITGVRLAGVDVITSDAGRPLSETGGAIIEVNAAPGLHHHYHVAAPSETTDVAVPVLERLLNSCGGTEVGGGSGR